MRFLDWPSGDGMVAHSVMLTRKGSLFAFEQTFDYRHRLSEPINPGCSTIESEARFVVFGSNAAGAQAKLKASLRQKIDCRGFTRDEHRMAEVVIKNTRANPKMLRCLGCTDQGWYWGDDLGEMIGHG